MLDQVDIPEEHCLGCATDHTSLLEFLDGNCIKKVFIIVVVWAEEAIDCAEQMCCHMYPLLLTTLDYSNKVFEVDFEVDGSRCLRLWGEVIPFPILCIVCCP